MKVELANRAVALNLAGVLAMDASDYGRAVESFSRALAVLKRVLARQRDSTGIRASPFPDSSLESSFAFSEASNSNHNNEGGFVFRCPIAVTAAPSSVARCGRFHVMLSFALLYNLGLAHHLSAIDEETSDAKLRRALSLYQLAFAVHVNEEVNLSLLQTMVISNNLGQVYASLGATDRALQCGSHLLSLILCTSGLCELERPESLDEFVGNVMHLLLKDSGSNAPAA